MTTLVGKNFEREVSAGELSVVYLFEPSDEDCQKFDPIYEELAKTFHSRNPGVKFFKMDVMLNESKGLKVMGIPNVSLYSKNWKKPVLYEQSLDSKELPKFLEDHMAKIFASTEL